MDVILNVPQQAATTVGVTIGNIIFDTRNKKALVDVIRADTGYEQVEVDLAPMIAVALPAQVTGVRLFVKTIIAKALGIDIVNIPDTLWQ